MKFILAIALLVSILLLSCKQKSAPKASLSTKFPIIIDSTNLKEFLPFHLDEDVYIRWNISTSNYPFYYLGKLEDTICLKRAIPFSLFSTPIDFSKESPTFATYSPKHVAYYVEWEVIKSYPIPLVNDLEIQARPKHLISNHFPVLLRNKSKDTLKVGYGSEINMFLEAKDKKGKWKIIQESKIYMCGNGVGDIILPPDEIAVTLAPCLKGPFKTELRFSVSNNQSTPFSGSIDPKQFERIESDENFK